MIHHVFHFSFTVSDLQQSVDWYTNVLGLELVHRQVQDNPYTRTLVGVPDAILEIAQFKIPGVSPGLSTHMLELVEYKHPKGEHPPLPTYNVGVGHVALLVTDIQSEYERLQQGGVVFRNPPVAITEGANRGGYACYFQDPDGITLEMLEPSPERQRAMDIWQG